jgi:organic hydroperoxide reductase OsmC/OhrA
LEKTHEYKSHLVWDGNLGEGTSSYGAYGRDYTVTIRGKPDLRGSADPMFRGNPELHNPEDLFLAAISGCHMLTYLALCARNGISVLSYEDAATGIVTFDGHGGGKFTEVTLNPVVRIDDASKESVAMTLHHRAHELCYIAQSTSAPIKHVATIEIVPPGDGSAD